MPMVILPEGAEMSAAVIGGGRVGETTGTMTVGAVGTRTEGTTVTGVGTMGVGTTTGGATTAAHLGAPG